MTDENNSQKESPKTTADGEKDNTPRAASKNARQVTVSTNHIIAATAIIVVCAVSFVCGAAYQRNHEQPPFMAGVSLRHMDDRLSPGMMGGGSRQHLGVLGSVAAVDSTSISINDIRTSTTQKFTINSSTVVLQEGQTSNVEAIKVGDKVAVVPSSADKSVAASIMILPNMQSTSTGL